MSDIVERISELLLAKAKRKREAIERATMKPLQCADINSALEYGRIQGIEMAAEAMKESPFVMINNEFGALRSRLEQAEKERDELRDRVNFTLTDHQRLLQRSDIESTCDTPDLCFAEGGPVRCGPCAIIQSRNEGVACFDWLPFSPEQYRLKRRAEAAERALADARNAAFEEAARIVQNSPLSHHTDRIAAAIRERVAP
ncbi:hypothetical protein [Rhizobium alvei]|uniref:Uncharacterized protein n=1 Tax=Rhizobium alvei TaxID=1132659 RepID=A0ABT8YRN2_9HYPH|nr:hypothetical protein [Rhizobium alvei]MDO6965815.1 hypothetical protein [Rhizobium alvei]